MSKLYLYSVFHMNLDFSSIPEDQYPIVINRCFWPLLNLIDESNIPLGIEAPAHTLLEIQKIDPSFITKLKELWHQKKCEFIGSSYTQAVFPLIPAEVNKWNLSIGNRYYKELLGKQPETVFVNEQCYSSGLPKLYKEAGYTNMIMEWNNPYKYNRYPKEYQYYPQIVVGTGGAEINLIWNNTIAFQKFQRYVHDELEIEGYLEYLAAHYQEGKDRAFPVYGSDAEIFDYRPGEPDYDYLKEKERREFTKIKNLFASISSDPRFSIIAPKELIRLFSGDENSFNKIKLESPEYPIPCKKQEKYNVTRWAVAGRDDPHINAQCYKLYKILKDADPRDLSELKESLCYLWGSDFRTHTTDEKFLDFRNKMGATLAQVKKLKVKEHVPPAITATKSDFKETSREVIIDNDICHLILNKDRGLTIKELTFKKIWARPLIGTIPHGYFDDISWGADFYSGNIMIVGRDGKRITDLVRVEQVVQNETGVGCRISLPIGILWKTYQVSTSEPRVDITYRFRFEDLRSSSSRLGIVTAIPDSFNRETLYYSVVNGGEEIEKFSLSGRKIEHDAAVSTAVSAKHCLGATEGWVAVGDGEKGILIRTDKSDLYSVPMIRYEEVDNSYFLRVYHSIGELDDTTNHLWRGHNKINFIVKGFKNNKIKANNIF